MLDFLAKVSTVRARPIYCDPVSYRLPHAESRNDSKEKINTNRIPPSPPPFRAHSFYEELERSRTFVRNATRGPYGTMDNLGTMATAAAARAPDLLQSSASHPRTGSPFTPLFRPHIATEKVRERSSSEALAIRGTLATGEAGLRRDSQTLPKVGCLSPAILHQCVAIRKRLSLPPPNHLVELKSLKSFN